MTEMEDSRGPLRVQTRRLASAASKPTGGGVYEIRAGLDGASREGWISEDMLGVLGEGDGIDMVRRGTI